MVSYSENDLTSIVIAITILNVLPKILKEYIGPQFVRAVEKNDIVRNITLLLGIIILVYLTNYESNKILLSLIIFIFFLLFSRQTILFNIIEILLITFIFTQYKNNKDFEDLKIYLYLLFIIMFLGYEQYYKKQVSDKGLRFSLIKFIFGKKEKDYDHDYVEFQPL